MSWPGVASYTPGRAERALGSTSDVSVKDIENYTTLALAVTAHPEGGDDVTLVIDKAIGVPVDLTVPSNMTLRFKSGGRLVIAAAATVTLARPGNVSAKPRQQVFECLTKVALADGAVAFTAGGVVYPQWWGALADDSNNDTAPLQAAVTALPALGGEVRCLSGTYKLTSAIEIGDRVHVVGVGSGWISILKQYTADTPCLITLDDENTSYIGVRRIAFDADEDGCYGLHGGSDSHYTANARLAECHFYASLKWGLYGQFAHIESVGCTFGRAGTAGTIFQPVYILGSTGVQFNNTFMGCWFTAAKGCNGAVEAETGNGLVFINCTWEICTTPAVYARGTDVLVLAGACEAIDVAGTGVGIFNVGQDASSNKSHITLMHHRVTQGDGEGDCDAIVATDTGGTVKFESCRFAASGHYWTVRPGTTTYDTRIIDILNVSENLASDITGLARAWSTRQFDDGVVVGNGTDGPGYVKLLEDGDNGANGCKLIGRANYSDADHEVTFQRMTGDAVVCSTGAGTPVAAVTPTYIGQEYWDTTGTQWYKSTGTVNTAWVAI